MNIIFHHPLPLVEDGVSASSIRPLKMVQAFQSLGYDVDLVTGYGAERERRFLKIKENVRQGKKYDFVYSESSTMPTILTEPNHLPLYPLVDLKFFRFCNNRNIPIGLFYRDIYWLFSGYGKGINSFKKNVAKFAYRLDLWLYKKTVKRLFLPSLRMGHYIPSISPDKFSELPPGAPNVGKESLHKNDKTRVSLKLFYVGGISNHYQLHELVAAVKMLPNIELILCTRKAEWEACKEEYSLLPPNIEVVHLIGSEMEGYLKKADIAVLYVKPHEYWSFAVPVKLYEYIGYLKPVLASTDTLAGEIVNEEGIGWTLPYDRNSVGTLLCELLENPELFNSVYQKLQCVAKHNTWQARAEKVSRDLLL